MTPTLIVLALLALGVVVVVWATRRKPTAAPPAANEGDTAWNDPISPAEAARRAAERDEAAPPSQEPRP